MIPKQKKTPEELAALRNELGIPGSKADPPPEKTPSPTELPFAETTSAAPSPFARAPEEPPAREEEPQPETPPTPKRRKSKLYSLRKEELPLAPAAVSSSKTALPSHRKSAGNLAEFRKREALANLSSQGHDPAAHLIKLTAHPALLTPAYLLAFGSAFAVWQRASYITPLGLISAAAILTLFIFAKKKRSRHHAAILSIIIVLILAFGGIRYAPLFSYAT